MTLKEKITTAFTDAAYPGDENITRCPYNCTECRITTEFFKGRKWQELSAGDARDHHGALNLFTPAALHYFLPAFMLASIDAYDRQDIIPDSIRAHFEFVLHHKGYFNVPTGPFTQGQKRAITEFLRLMESKGAGSSEDAIGALNEEQTA